MPATPFPRSEQPGGVETLPVTDMENDSQRAMLQGMATMSASEFDNFNKSIKSNTTTPSNIAIGENTHDHSGNPLKRKSRGPAQPSARDTQGRDPIQDPIKHRRVMFQNGNGLSAKDELVFLNKQLEVAISKLQSYEALAQQANNEVMAIQRDIFMVRNGIVTDTQF